MILLKWKGDVDRRRELKIKNESFQECQHRNRRRHIKDVSSARRGTCRHLDGLSWSWWAECGLLLSADGKFES